MSELTAPEGLADLGSGKVRDLYEVDDGHLLLVASDRISAFDVVLDDPVPGKGEVLTALTVFWLDLLADLVPNHLAGWRASELPPAARHLAGRAMLVRRLDMVPFECVARGYLVGSGWKDYQATGAVCGIPLPPSCARPTGCPSRSTPRPPRPRPAMTRTSPRPRWPRRSAPTCPAASAT